MKILVTGGAGFIGRWVVRRLLQDGMDVWAMDNLSNGNVENLAEFAGINHYHGLVIGDIVDISCVENFFAQNFDICIHAAAQINVQDSLENPGKYFRDNVTGTFNILECARKFHTKVVLVGTCLVYDTAQNCRQQTVDSRQGTQPPHAGGKLSDSSPVKPSSPYAASKLAAEFLSLSYYYGFGLPVVLLRPFNTYGPFQKSNMEGGVVSIFIKNYLSGEKLKVFGDGNQTRDLLYVEDCADFIIEAAYAEKAIGQIINAGTGKDISIKDLARLICPEPGRIEHVEHHHPQSEIYKLQCDNSRAKELLGWEPGTSLMEGIQKTREWIEAEDLKHDVIHKGFIS